MQTEKLTIVNCCARIRDLCENSGRSQKELATALGISEGALINYKRDRIPKTEELHKLASHFGTTMDYIYAGTGVSPSVADKTAWQGRAEKAERKIAMLKKMLQAALAEL